MNDVFIQIATYAAILAPFVAMFVEVIKKANFVPKGYLPTVAVAVGILFAVVISLAHPEFGNMLDLGIAGATAGGIASGVYKLASQATVNKASK